MDYKKIIIIILVFIVLAAIGFAVTNLFNVTNSPSATIKDQTFKLLVAKSDEEKQIGLSRHESLPADSGMIFLFNKADFYSFWMKDMKFPIDILYINGNRIVTIYKNQKPERSGNPPILTPKEESDKVLEINAGLSDKYKFSEGDKIKFENLE